MRAAAFARYAWTLWTILFVAADSCAIVLAMIPWGGGSLLKLAPCVPWEYVDFAGDMGWLLPPGEVGGVGSLPFKSTEMSAGGAGEGWAPEGSLQEGLG